MALLRPYLCTPTETDWLVFCAQAPQACPQTHRGAGVRSVAVPEPELYRRYQLSVSDAQGVVDFKELIPMCPTALQCPLYTERCCIIRKGSATRHGVITSQFPVAISGVSKFLCTRHDRSFSILHPAVFESLPAGTVVQPSLVVLTASTIFMEGAYHSLGEQVILLSRIALLEVPYNVLLCPSMALRSNLLIKRWVKSKLSPD